MTTWIIWQQLTDNVQCRDSCDSSNAELIFIIAKPRRDFSLRLKWRKDERYGTDGRTRNFYCRGSSAHAPTITQILGNLTFSSISYSYILIRVSAFSELSEAAPSLVIESLYGLSRVDREVFTQAKARSSSDAPLKWCMPHASSSTVYRIARNFGGQNFGELVISRHWRFKNLANESKQRTPALNLDGLAIKILANLPNSPNFWSAKISSYTRTVYWLHCWSTPVFQLNGVLCRWFNPGRWATEGYRSHQYDNSTTHLVFLLCVFSVSRNCVILRLTV